MFGLGFAELIVISVMMAVFLIPMIFYLLTLQKAFERCSPENRALSSGLIWLLLIPLFNLVWNFIVVSRLSKSLQNEFAKRNISVGSQPGRSVGLAMCILMIGSLIPYIGILMTLAGVICWIVYWVKIAGYSTRLRAIEPVESITGFQSV